MSPGAQLLFAAFVCLALCASVLYLATSTPWLGLTLVPDDAGLVRIADAKGPAHGIPKGARLVALGTPEGPAFSLQALDLIEEPDFFDSYVEQSAFYARQTELARIFESPQVVLHIEHAGTQTKVPVTHATRPPLDLPALFWFQLFAGASGFLIAAWAFVASPQSLAARCFGCMGAMFLVFTAPAAYYGTRELFVEATLFRILAAINHFGAFAFGAALMGLFLCHPRKLLGTRGLWLLPAIFVPWYAADLTQVVSPDLGYRIPILLEMLSAMALASVQWHVTRGDPRARAELRWLGLSVIVGAGLFVFCTAGVSIIGIEPPFAQGYAFGFFSLMYVGFALGLRRHQLLGLDEWAYRILLWVLGAVLLIVVDLALVLFLGTHSVVSLSASLLICGFLYLPLRNWLWARAVSARPNDAPELFQSVIDAAFAPTASEQERLWVRLLESMFQPAEIFRGEANAPDCVTISDAGLNLSIPALDGARALRLTFPWRGRGLFELRHLHLAETLVSLMRHAEAARQEFARGARSERKRIARDLHDNLGARLLTGLYAESVQDTREGIRHAISDMRSIVQELTNDAPCPLSELLADLRHETAERSRMAGLVLEWPYESTVSETTLSPALARHYSAILRELVSNALRHANASTLRVTTRVEADALVTTFEDNGIGIAEGEHESAMHSVRSRLQELGGTLSFHAASRGTSLEIVLPLNVSADTEPRRSAQ